MSKLKRPLLKIEMKLGDIVKFVLSDNSQIGCGIVVKELEKQDYIRTFAVFWLDSEFTAKINPSSARETRLALIDND